jgi:hypothetical protein
MEREQAGAHKWSLLAYRRHRNMTEYTTHMLDYFGSPVGGAAPAKWWSECNGPQKLDTKMAFS